MLDTHIKTNLQTNDYELTDDVQQYLERRLKSIERLLNLDDTSIMCDVELARNTQHHQQGDKIYHAEFNLTMADGQFYAAADEESMTAAIDEAKKELRKELRRQKGRAVTETREMGRKLKEFMQGKSKS
jgi:ribosomal subunit interface protein